MPSVFQVAEHPKWLMHRAPKANREQIQSVIDIYTNRRNVPRNIAEKVVTALYMPSMFGRVGKRGKLGKAEDIYEDFLGRYLSTRM